MHDESRALARAAFDLDRAAMQLEHHGHEVQPDAAAGHTHRVRAAKIALEQMDAAPVGNSYAVVAHPHQQSPALVRLRDDFDGAARGRVLDGVGYEITEQR